MNKKAYVGLELWKSIFHHLLSVSAVGGMILFSCYLINERTCCASFRMTFSLFSLFSDSTDVLRTRSIQDLTSDSLRAT